MNFSDIVSPLYTTAQMTLAEKGIASAKVILTGFVVVFAMLFLLIAIIKIYSTIVTNVMSTGERKKQSKIEEVNTVTSAPVVSAPAVPTVQDGVPEEVVAVISAAVATMYGSSAKARIKSIKKTNNGRSAWANAGVLDNTRPF